MKVEFTHIINTFDTNPETIELEWDDLCSLLAGYAEIQRQEYQKTGETPAIYPTVYAKGSNGKDINNVLYLSNWFGLDIDNGMSFDDLKLIMDGLGCPYFIHTTTKHTDKKPRLRALFLTNRNVEIEEYKSVWGCINEMFGNIVDCNTKNINRILYVPAKWNNQSKCCYNVIGTPINIDWVLSQYQIVVDDKSVDVEYELSKLKTMQKKLALQNKKFDTNKLITEKMISDLGASAKGGRFYKFMVRLANRALFFDYPLTAPELEKFGVECDRDVNHTKERPNSLGEAKRALAYAYSVFTPPTRIISDEEKSFFKSLYNIVNREKING